MAQYFIHNGYCGWSYGTPSDPQLVSAEDAAELMRRAGLSADQVSTVIPPAQYANEDEPLYGLTGNNRFIFFGEAAECADVDHGKISSPFRIQWPQP
ncbi:hypothetical protein M2404_002168 [Rheinheimera pacifica]|nr:hypothetical protein [Rheinheimera pacifica]